MLEAQCRKFLNFEHVRNYSSFHNYHDYLQNTCVDNQFFTSLSELDFLDRNLLLIPGDRIESIGCYGFIDKLVAGNIDKSDFLLDIHSVTKLFIPKLFIQYATKLCDNDQKKEEAKEESNYHIDRQYCLLVIYTT